MGALTDSLTAVESVLTAQSIATVIKQFSTTTPPTVEHAVLTVEASSLDREDTENFGGGVTVTVDWFYPGDAADGQTQFLAAMDRLDVLVSALASGLDRTCQSIDPGGNIERMEESADLAHWYTATITATFMRKEPATV